MHHPRIHRTALVVAALLLAGAPALAQECTKYVSEAGSGRVARPREPAPADDVRAATAADRSARVPARRAPRASDLAA